MGKVATVHGNCTAKVRALMLASYPGHTSCLMWRRVNFLENWLLDHRFLLNLFMWDFIAYTESSWFPGAFTTSLVACDVQIK